MKKRPLFLIAFILAATFLVSCKTRTTTAIEQTPPELATHKPENTAPSDIVYIVPIIPTEEPSNGDGSAAINGPPDTGDIAQIILTEESLNDDGSGSVGVIVGDVLYNGIGASWIFSEMPENTLGAPLHSSGPHRFYNGLEIYYAEYVDNIMGKDLSLFSIGDVKLDKNRAELIDAFGKPIEYYEYPGYTYRSSDDDRVMRYHVSNCVLEYMLDFWFDNPGEKANSFRIKRMGV
jgi:hypothetical protein